MTDTHRDRRDRLRARLSDLEVDAVLCSWLANVRWLTGFTGSNGQVLVAADPELDLFLTDGRYEEQAVSEVLELDRAVQRGSGAALFAQRLAAGRTQRLGFEAERISWSQGEALRDLGRDHDLEVVPMRDAVERLRAIKDGEELAQLREACRLTDEAFAYLLGVLAPGTTEQAAAVVVERAMVDAGAEGPAFDTIVAAGRNGARPHHRAGPTPIAAGELVTVDLGAKVGGYHADMTRTIAVGEPSTQLRDLHDLVRTAQAAGVAAAVPGVEVGAVDAACRTVIDDAGLGRHFVHPTGHGVGLEIHEWPTVAAEATATLEEGMTVTVEPGVYVPGIGGVRIEDTVAITAAAGPEVLTSTPRELIVL